MNGKQLFLSEDLVAKSGLRKRYSFSTSIIDYKRKARYGERRTHLVPQNVSRVGKAMLLLEQYESEKDHNEIGTLWNYYFIKFYLGELLDQEQPQ